MAMETKDQVKCLRGWVEKEGGGKPLSAEGGSARSFLGRAGKASEQVKAS